MMVAGASAAPLWLGSDMAQNFLDKCSACPDIMSAQRFMLIQIALTPPPG